jgi:hypothetical protein
MALRAAGERLRKPVRRFEQYTALIIVGSSFLGFVVRVLIGFGPIWPLIVAPLTLTPLLALNDAEFMDWLRRYRRGAKGEERVGRVLGALCPSGYQILHGRERIRGDIDHIPIGPTGVVVIETKAWRGRVYVGQGRRLALSGFDQHRTIERAAQTAREVHAALARAGIRTWVEAVIVLTATDLPKGSMRFGAVDVITVQELSDFVLSRQRELTEGQVAEAREVLLSTFH